jgi:hypothetical protein
VERETKAHWFSPEIAVMAFWIFASFTGFALESSRARVLAVAGTLGLLGYMAWVIRDSRKINTKKDGQLHRGPDPFLSGRRR